MTGGGLGMTVLKFFCRIADDYDWAGGEKIRKAIGIQNYRRDVPKAFAGMGEDSGIDLHAAGIHHGKDGLAALRKAGFDGLMCQDFQGIYRNQRHASAKA